MSNNKRLIEVDFPIEQVSLDCCYTRKAHAVTSQGIYRLSGRRRRPLGSEPGRS